MKLEVLLDITQGIAEIVVEHELVDTAEMLYLWCAAADWPARHK